MTKLIGVAVLGVGRWGVHLVRNFQAHPLSEVRAVVDPRSERLTEVKEHLKLGDRTVMATSWEEIRQLEGIDAVVVATPASTHYALVADALNRGYHVLAEKPLSLDPAECIELTRLAQQKERQLMVDHIYLFNPAVERGREVIQSGEIGEHRYGYASRTHLGPVRQDVDALWDLAIHDIAIFNHWLGRSPAFVQAQGNIWLQPREVTGGQGLADLVWATLTYANGFQAFIHLCWINPDKQRRLVVVGTQGSLIFDELAPEPLMLQRGFLTSDAERFVPAGVSREVLRVEAAEPLGRVCDRFLENLFSPSLSISDGWVSAELVQILRCLSQSLQQGKVIPVPSLR